MLDVNLKVGDKSLAKVASFLKQLGVWTLQPGATVRQAKADAQAIEILARAEVKADDIRHRASTRVAIQEVRRQANLEAIAAEALKALPSEPAEISPAELDPDWANFFADRCQDVSDEEMRKLWGRIGAAELATPRTFSRQTLAVIGLMGRAEKEAFERVCGLTWRGGNKAFIPLIHVRDLDPWVPFDDQLALDSCGLLQVHPVALTLTGDSTLLAGGRRVLRIEIDRPKELGVTTLTRAGFELASIVDAPPSAETFHEMALEAMRDVRLPTSSPWPRHASERGWFAASPQ